MASTKPENFNLHLVLLVTKKKQIRQMLYQFMAIPVLPVRLHSFTIETACN